MPFLYYLPGLQSGLPLETARAAGLAYALDGPISTVGVRGGPDGGDGVVLALAKSIQPEELSYHPDRQTWRKIPACSAWVGLSPESRVQGPGSHSTLGSQLSTSLARAKQLGGHEVVLADGRRWLVPMARGWVEQDGDLRWYHNLPQQSVLADDGRWSEGDVLPRYAPLWELAMRFEDARRVAVSVETPGDGESVRVQFDFDGLHQAAVRCLQENYRIGPAEAALLNLLTADISREICEALIDIPTRLEWFKKKQSAPPAAGLSTAAGSPAETPDTGPRVPTSGR